MNKDKRNNIQLLGTLNNADESGIIANANQIYDANEDKSTQDVSKEHKERIETLETKESSMQTTLENITKTGEASAASNVTYNHNDSKLDATNMQQAIDEVYSKGNTNRENDKTELEKSISDNKTTIDNSIQDVYKKSNYNDGENIIDFNTIHLITDNPEYICVAVDADEKILYGIKTDGQPYFGVGCPQQVKDYIDEQINKILGTNDITTTIDSLKEIEAFLKDFTNSDTLKKLLDLKANVDEVRTTTDDIYKKSNPNDREGNVIDTNTIISFEDNPEYIKALTDSIGKLIEAIGIDGIRRFFAGINVQGTLQCITDNPEYIAVWLDNQNRIVFGFKTNGDTYFGYGVPSQISSLVEALKSNTEARIDALQQSIDNKFNRTVSKEDGKSLIDKNIADGLLEEDNPELIDAKIDTDGKLISYRDDSGKLHENAGIITKTIKAENIEYTQSNLSNLSIALKKSGYNFSPIDWSDYISKDGDNPLCLPIPSRGYLNVITDNSTYDRLGLIDNQEAQVEYWDMLGNYFKKAALISQQGNSTRMHYKRNFTIDFFDSDIGGDAFSIKFGDWVAQDSYHVKAYYNDIIKGVSIIAYKLYNDIDKTYGVLEDRPYKEYWSPSGNTATSDSSDISRNTSCDARTISDGFPIIVYLNGEFYGVFAFSLKKHRDNYQLDRNKTDNIHLDGTLGSAFWSGNIIWSDFEIRNPKPKSKKWNFLTQNNSSYSEGAEPMGKDSAFYNANNISCVNSAEVKDNIVALSKYMSELKTFSDAYEADKTDANLNTFKTEFEKRFGLKWLIDYIIFITVVMDGDSLAKNWQWITWGKKDGIMKWYVRPWDMDGIFGENSTDGFSITPAYWFNYIFGNESNLPTYYVIKYYSDNINTRYKELRDLDVISYRHFTQVIEDWAKRIGEDNFKHEYEEKWTESPCFRDNNISEDWNYDKNINPRSYITWNDDASNYNSLATYSKGSWCKYDHKMFESITDNNTGHLPTETNYWKQVSYKEGDTFKKGDYVWDGYSNFFKFFANKDTSSKPLTKVYDHYPREGGNFDSMLRICSFVKDRIAAADKIFKYNN